ncbi:MAG: hypothetical protein WC292_01430 [Clostridia bacterium]
MRKNKFLLLIVLVFLMLIALIACNISDENVEGTGEKDDPYVLKTKAHLISFAEVVNSGETYENAYFALGANINLDNMDWTAIGTEIQLAGDLDEGLPPPDIYSFNGNFDGRMYTISHFKAE